MRNKIVSLLAALTVMSTYLYSVCVFAEEPVVITEQAGWFESAYVKWQPVENCDGYNVYYRKADAGDYIKIDDELIREYPSYMRADVIGLAKGEYVIKVVPKSGGGELESLAAETEVLTVDNYAREGFAFSESSPYKTTTGGYNEDGTVAPGCEIIYVTNKNKDTLTVGGDEAKGVGLYNIMAYRQKNKIETPMIIRFIGKVEMPAGVENYMLDVKETKNVTIEGVGDDGTVHGWGFTMKRACNIEVRNIGIMWYGGVGGDGDSLSLDTENKNIWMHNVDFFYGAPGKDADQVKGDGSIDIKSRSDYITSSYNHFWDSGKACVAGGVWESKNPDDPEAKVNITYHHNWFDHSDSRHPRCVAGNTHVYNNYYDGVAKYGIGAAVKSSVFVEKNYFRNCPRPMIIATQGSDVWDGTQYTNKGTLSGQDGGMIKEFDNVIIGAKRFYTYQTTPDEGEFDAYTASSREEQVPESVAAKVGGSTYNNFDTTEGMLYDYAPDTAEEARDKVIKYAGRMNGGDFKWVFGEGEDSNSEVIPELQQAIINYESQLVLVPSMEGDEPVVTENPDATPTPTPTATPYIDPSDTISHNFTADGLTSSFFTFSDTCSMSTSYGTVEYKGLSLTRCLKVGTGTAILFTAPADGTATLVFSVEKGKRNIKVNGVKTFGDDLTGLLTFEVKAGEEYLLEKQDSSYLFYIEIVPLGGGTPTAEPSLYDYEIKSAAVSDSGADVDVVFGGEEAKSDVVLIAAEYAEDSQILTNMQIVSIDGSGTYHIDGLSPSESTELKLFIWDGDQMPQAEPYTLQ